MEVKRALRQKKCKAERKVRRKTMFQLLMNSSIKWAWIVCNFFSLEDISDRRWYPCVFRRLHTLENNVQTDGKMWILIMSAEIGVRNCEAILRHLFYLAKLFKCYYCYPNFTQLNNHQNTKSTLDLKQEYATVPALFFCKLYTNQLFLRIYTSRDWNRTELTQACQALHLHGGMSYVHHTVTFNSKNKNKGKINWKTFHRQRKILFLPPCPMKPKHVWCRTSNW
jgi:hypothetical protein